MKQLVARAQLFIEEIGKGLDAGNALQSWMGQYPEIGVELNEFCMTGAISQDRESGNCFPLDEKLSARQSDGIAPAAALWYFAPGLTEIS